MPAIIDENIKRELTGTSTGDRPEKNHSDFSIDFHQHLNEFEEILSHNQLEQAMEKHDELMDLLAPFIQNNLAFIRMIENEAFIKRVIGKYEEQIISKLKDAFARQDRAQIKEMLKVYIDDIVQSSIMPQRISPVFFDDDFIELIKKNEVPLKQLMELGIYAEISGSPEEYEIFLEKLENIQLQEEYRLRKIVQQDYFAAAQAIGGSGAYSEALEQFTVYVNSLSDYKDFCVNNMGEFEALSRGLLSKSAVMKHCKLNQNDKQKNLFKCKFNGSDNARKLFQEVFEDYTEHMVQSQADMICQASLELSNAAEYAKSIEVYGFYQSGIQSNEDKINVEKYGVRTKERLSASYLMFENTLFTLETEIEKNQLIIQFFEGLMQHVKNDQTLQDESEAIVLLALQKQGCETLLKVVNHFMDRNAHVFHPIFSKLLDRLIESTKYQYKNEQMLDLLEKVRKAKDTLTREQSLALIKALKKDGEADGALTAFEKTAANHKNAEITEAIARANELKYDLSYTIYETLAKTAVSSVDAKQVPEVFTNTKDGKLVHYALDRLDSMTLTINGLAGYKKGNLFSEEVAQRIAREDKEARKDSLGWSIFGVAIKAFLVAAGAIVGAVAGLAIGSLLTGGIGAVPGVALGAIMGAKFSLSLIACTAIGATVGLSGGIGLAVLAGGAIAQRSLKRHKTQEDKPLPKRRSCFSFFSRSKDMEKTEKSESLPMANS